MNGEPDELPGHPSEESLQLGIPPELGQRAHAWLVILLPQMEPPEERIRDAFAGAMDIDGYTARLILESPFARMLMQTREKERAERWRDWLRALKLRALIVPETHFADQIFQEQTEVYRTGGGLLFKTADGFEEEVPVESVCAIVFGEIVDRELIERERKGFFSSRQLPGEHQVVRDELVLDIHRRDGPVSFRMRQDSFNFEKVFSDEGSLPLMQKLFRKLQKEVPHASVFQDFPRALGAMGPSTVRLAEELRVVLNWRRPGRTIEPEKVTRMLESNAAAFDLYSVMCRLESLTVLE
jgi:hypothetical protein